tara:strand:+ start:604 stop:1164 length:561 start_codon:yes stop_codon:yes gene_type:complete
LLEGSPRLTVEQWAWGFPRFFGEAGGIAFLIGVAGWTLRATGCAETRTALKDVIALLLCPASSDWEAQLSRIHRWQATVESLEEVGSDPGRFGCSVVGLAISVFQLQARGKMDNPLGATAAERECSHALQGALVSRATYSSPVGYEQEADLIRRLLCVPAHEALRGPFADRLKAIGEAVSASLNAS